MRTSNVPATIRAAADLLDEHGLYLPHPAYEPRDGALTPIEAIEIAAGDDAGQVLAWLGDEPTLYPEPGTTAGTVATALRDAAHRIESSPDHYHQVRRDTAAADKRLVDELVPQWCAAWATEHRRNELMIDMHTDGVMLMRGILQPGGGHGWRHRIVAATHLNAAAVRAYARRRDPDAGEASAEAAVLATLDERLTALLAEPVRWTTEQGAAHLRVSTSRYRALMAEAGIRPRRTDATWDADRVITFAEQRPGQGARTDLQH